jgi:hypothetical protein
MYGGLTCLGRRTVTGMLSASGKQFIDWSASYRLFSKQKIDVGKIFEVLQNNVLKENDMLPYVVGHMDDTIIKKTGKKIPGTAWRRDPLGPPFHTNFIWGQRFIQISLALPCNGEISQSRAIPVDFHHCPSAVKPNRKATQEQWQEYKEVKRISKLSRQGSNRISVIRGKLDEQGAKDKDLIISVDGSYTNREVLKTLPDRVTLIGRIRKDTKLYLKPNQQHDLGRKRVYGDRLPTPEQIRQSDLFPWQKVTAWAAGKKHQFNIKVVKNVRWRSAGEKHDLTLIVISPLGYRLSKGSKILYRDPAYLLTTKSEHNIDVLLQSYLWRWEIEVNFREEKTIMGCGQAQVRNPYSIESIPAFIASLYGLLHLAYQNTKNVQNIEWLPRPKWYKKRSNDRTTTGDLLNNLRAQIWARATENNFSDFVNQHIIAQSQRNVLSCSQSAAFYVRN